MGLALLAMPTLALAATVKGKISGGAKLLNPVWNEAKDPTSHRYTFREFSPTVSAEARNLTSHLPKELCIAALGKEGKPAQLPMLVVVTGGRTTPVTLVVAPGQQLQFANHDPFPHRLYAVGQSSFAAEEIASAKTRAWTPPGPGVYEIRDKVSPSVRSWIVVEPRVAAIAYPDRAGDFAMELVPGSYELRAYHNGQPVGTPLPVEVGAQPLLQLGAPLAVAATEADAGGK